MKKIIRKIAYYFGWCLCTFSWIAALYITFVTCFTFGLVQFVDGWILLSAHDIVIGFCKVLLCWIPGLVVALTGTAAGIILVEWGDDFWDTLNLKKK